MKTACSIAGVLVLYAVFSASTPSQNVTHASTSDQIELNTAPLPDFRDSIAVHAALARLGRPIDVVIPPVEEPAAPQKPVPATNKAAPAPKCKPGVPCPQGKLSLASQIPVTLCSQVGGDCDDGVCTPEGCPQRPVSQESYGGGDCPEGCHDGCNCGAAGCGGRVTGYEVRSSTGFREGGRCGWYPGKWAWKGSKWVARGVYRVGRGGARMLWRARPGIVFRRR